MVHLSFECLERVEVDAGERPGVASAVEARAKELERENAELRRANEILKTALGVFRRGGARLATGSGVPLPPQAPSAGAGSWVLPASLDPSALW